VTQTQRPPENPARFISLLRRFPIMLHRILRMRSSSRFRSLKSSKRRPIAQRERLRAYPEVRAFLSCGASRPTRTTQTL
jgi:hypothetical protein